MNILGLSFFYHDSAACLLKENKIVAAASEERFTRKKHDSNFPINAINYCLKEGNINIKDVDYIGFYEKPFVKFERIIETYISGAPLGFRSFVKAMPLWLKQKLWIPDLIKKELFYKGEIIFTDHHQSHAASSFFVSPFKEAAILTADGVGEWTTTSYGYGRGNKITLTHELKFPHSLGLLYAAFTYYLGFKINSGEYKVMGLAPYGKPKYYNTIMNNLVELKDDGSFKLNMKYFDYLWGLTMTNRKLEELFEYPRRKPETKLEDHHFNIAYSIQKVTDEIMLHMANHIHKETKLRNLCLSGGVALNCVANGRILRESPFDDIFIQPAAGDAGGAVGAASFIYYSYLGNKRRVNHNFKFSKAFNKNNFNFFDKKNKSSGIKTTLMESPFLGPGYSNNQIKRFLDRNSFYEKEKSIIYEELNRKDLIKRTAELITKKYVIGWFQGRMEFGPRALGSRSIIADPRDKKMQDIVNLKIKLRESFRPFAPTVLVEHIHEFFDIDRPSPYMLLVAQVKKDKRIIPAVTHIDGSARIQSIAQEDNPLYYDMINEFYKLTGVPVIINTSFNIRGEPIVCTPEDAFKCFMRTDMDYLVMGNFLMDKKDQTPLEKDIDWQKEFELD